MFKNVASQKIALFAYDSTTGAPKTGDGANITPYVSKDYGTVTALGTATATEMDSTNAKGWYSFVLTQGETNGDALLFTAKSSTANAYIVGALVYTDPPNFSTLSVDGSGNAAANITQVNADSTAAVNLQKSTDAICRGTCTTGGSTTSIVTSAFSPGAGASGQFIGRTVIFDANTTTTALRGQATNITASTNSATPTLTVTAMTTAPASGDTFSIV
jgi:hypothetical protein